MEGNFTLEGGTSASSPIFASLVNRIVEERIRTGKGPVGFINPALYQHPEVLNDITNGTNPGCMYCNLCSMQDQKLTMLYRRYPRILCCHGMVSSRTQRWTGQRSRLRHVTFADHTQGPHNRAWNSQLPEDAGFVLESSVAEH